MSKYSVLALDLDGTLLNDQKEITSLTKNVLEVTNKFGVEIVFATGRGIQKVEHLIQDLKFDLPMVLLNGAEIRANANQVLERHFISKNDIYQLYANAVEFKVNFWGYNANEFVGAEEWNDQMFNKHWMKFGFSHKDVNVINQLRVRLEQTFSLEITNSSENNIECSKLGITKEFGLKKICDFLGEETSQVLAIGDNMNDYGLIEEAGLGVAMGNAAHKVKEIADDITHTNNQDGVAKAIEKYILK